MSYTIEYLEKEKIALITNTIEFTYEDFRKQAREALELSQVKKCNKFLVDCTLTTSKLQATTMPIYNTAVFYDEIGAPRENKIALVVPTGAETEADLRFYETVSVNRGRQVKVFSDKDSAMHWLQQ